MKRENEARTRLAACVAGGDACGTKLVGDPSGYPGEKLSFDPTLAMVVSMDELPRPFAILRTPQVHPP